MPSQRRGAAPPHAETPGAGQASSGNAASGQASSRKAGSGKAGSGQASSRKAGSGQAASGHVKAEESRSGRAGLLLPLLMSGLAALAVLPWLPSEILLNGDDALYGAIARGMAEGGPWLFPRWGDIPFMDKPPLLTWATALSFRLFGIGDVTAKLFPALSGALAIAACWWLGLEVGVRRRFLPLVCLLLAGSVWHLHYSRRLLADMPMALCFLTAAAAYLRGYRQPIWIGGAGAFVGLAAMLKGLAVAPFVLVLILHTLLFEHGLTGRVRRLFGLGGTALAVVLPWHLAALVWERREFMDTYIGYQVLAKLGKNVDLAARPASFYLTELWAADPLLALLGAAALGLTAVQLLRARLQGRPITEIFGPDASMPGLWLLLMWVAVTWVVFSSATVKHTTYVLHTVAPMLLLLGALLAPLEPRRILTGLLTGLAALVLGYHTLTVSIYSTYWEEGIVAMGMTVARSPDLKALGLKAAEVAGPGAQILAIDLYPMAPAFYSGIRTRWVMTSAWLYQTLTSNPVLGRSGVAVHVPGNQLQGWLAGRSGDLVMLASGLEPPEGVLDPIERRQSFTLWRVR